MIAALRQASLDASGGRLPDDFSVALLYDGGHKWNRTDCNCR